MYKAGSLNLKCCRAITELPKKSIQYDKEPGALGEFIYTVSYLQKPKPSTVSEVMLNDIINVINDGYVLKLQNLYYWLIFFAAFVVAFLASLRSAERALFFSRCFLILSL